MKHGTVHSKTIDWAEVEREYAEILGPDPEPGALGDAELQKLADDTLEPLRECLLPLAGEVDSLPTTGVRGFVADLAARHGTTYPRTPLTDWGNSVARVLGDYVELDETERLLVALKNTGVIDGRQAARLIANHFRERKAAVNGIR